MIRYVEHANLSPLPDTIEVCDRCQRNVLVFLGIGSDSVYVRSSDRPDPYCWSCGGGTGGVHYMRVSDESRVALSGDLPDMWGDKGLRGSLVLPSSSEVEHPAVNREVGGSSPPLAATPQRAFWEFGLHDPCRCGSGVPQDRCECVLG